MSMSAIQEKINAVVAALETQPPFCTGLIELDEKSSLLFYRKSRTTSGIVDFTSPDVQTLQELTDTCLPAMFGRGNQDIYDESYRKAKKMNTNDFNIALDPSRIVQAIRSTLLDGKNQNDELELELYQLNVYDKGSFFKAHRDTPRRRNMFASLVIVFPTPHEGGKLLLRHDEEEWTFDSADILSKATTPSAAFIAFYSDVEHEVTPVESGYRVTITYNIYRGGSDSVPEPPAITIQSNRNLDASLFKSAIADLLQDQTCLPDGGFFGFGLRFLYPAFGGASISLKKMLNQLKGSDSVINQVCKSLSLQTSLQIYLEHEQPSLLADAWDLSCASQIDDLEDFLGDDVTRIYDFITQGPDSYHSDKGYPIYPTLWLFQPTSYVEYSSDYIAYGNMASLSNIYGYACLVAKVGPIHERETA